MAPRHLAEHLHGEELEIFPLLSLGTQVDDVAGGRRRHGGAVGAVDALVDDVLQHGHAQFRVDRKGDAEPDAVCQRLQRLRLVRLEHHVAGLHRPQPEVLRDRLVQGRPGRGPRLVHSVELEQGVAAVQGQFEAAVRRRVGGQGLQLPLQLVDLEFDQLAGCHRVLGALGLAEKTFCLQVLHGVRLLR